MASCNFNDGDLVSGACGDGTPEDSNNCNMNTETISGESCERGSGNCNFNSGFIEGNSCDDGTLECLADNNISSHQFS